MENTVENFDFLIGSWQVYNKRLKKRLINCGEWESFYANMTSKRMFNNLIIYDEMTSSEFGENFIGLSLRMYNPETNEWTIYWADTDHLSEGIKIQVKGTFKNNLGIFYGKEKFKDQLVELRFVWKLLPNGNPYWEQAYFDQETESWETNWTMTFIRDEV